MTSPDPTLELEHDRWFREQVRSTQARLESRETHLIPHDEFRDDRNVRARLGSS